MRDKQEICREVRKLCRETAIDYLSITDTSAS